MARVTLHFNEFVQTLKLFEAKCNSVIFLQITTAQEQKRN